MITIDLNGPGGNAYALRAHAKRWAKDLGLDYKKIHAEMTSGDYDNLVAAMRKYFGEMVEFTNKGEEDE